MKNNIEHKEDKIRKMLFYAFNYLDMVDVVKLDLLPQLKFYITKTNE